MFVVRHEFYKVEYKAQFHIIPIGDVHMGALACDENLLRQTIKRIEENNNFYWIGMGDYCEFIPVGDRKRFDPKSLAKWISVSDLGDISAKQRDRFLDAVSPIANKCLGLVEGNHERTVKKYYERDIFSEILCEIKKKGKFDSDEKLSLGGYGWIQLAFYRNKDGKRRNGNLIKINAHHGFVGGKLAGAKALNMQRWLWTHDADIVLFGHSHNNGVQSEAVMYTDRNCNIKEKIRKGAYCGTFLKRGIEGANTYSEIGGYFPLPTSGIEIILTPFIENVSQQIRIVM